MLPRVRGRGSAGRGRPSPPNTGAEREELLEIVREGVRTRTNSKRTRDAEDSEEERTQPAARRLTTPPPPAQPMVISKFYT